MYEITVRRDDSVVASFYQTKALKSEAGWLLATLDEPIRVLPGDLIEVSRLSDPDDLASERVPVRCIVSSDNVRILGVTLHG